jgi:hypothetical protein
MNTTAANDTNTESLTAQFIKDNEDFCLGLTCLQLAVFLGVEGYIIHKVRRMFELSTILTISMYTVCLLLRAV